MKLYRVFSNGFYIGSASLTPEQVRRATADGLTIIRA